MASVRRTVTVPLAFVVCVLVVAGVAATPRVAVGESLGAAAPQESSAVETSLALDRSTRRLIQQGLRNEGLDVACGGSRRPSCTTGSSRPSTISETSEQERLPHPDQHGKKKTPAVPFVCTLKSSSCSAFLIRDFLFGT